VENIEDVHCMAAIEAVLHANLSLMNVTIQEAISAVSAGKPDTLGMDAIPERAIERSLQTFDAEAVLITEEIGAAGGPFPDLDAGTHQPTFYISDPTDRSAQLNEFLQKEDQRKKVGSVMNIDTSRNKWAAEFGAPPSITGASSAITCIRYGVPIATAIVNYLTQELFVASKRGVTCMNIPSDLEPSTLTLEQLRSKSKRILFPAVAKGDDTHYFTTFLGKEVYPENFAGMQIFYNPDEELTQFGKDSKPGGPTRPLYLSDIQPPENPLGFILANGEKISEWIHWLPFVRFGRMSHEISDNNALVMYELSQDRPMTKDGILMSTSPIYSIFRPSGKESSDMIIDVNKLRSIPNPSNFRATLLVTHKMNYWANDKMRNNNKFRRISFARPKN
jgi:hypothetical protein